jgi:hypothetical protein
MPAASVYSSLQLSISAEIIHTASYFKLPSGHKTRIPAPPSPKHGKMPIRVTALAFDLCVLYYCSPCIICTVFPSPVKIWKKRVAGSLKVFLEGSGVLNR